MKGKRFFLLECLLGVFLLLLQACGNATSGQTSASSGQSSTPSGQTSGQQPSGSPLIGTWTTGGGPCSIGFFEFRQATFNADNTLTLDSIVIKFNDVPQQNFSGGHAGTVSFIAPPGTVQITYVVHPDGNVLDLSDTSPNGKSCTMARAVTNGGQEIKQSLIGVWAGNRCGFYDGSGFSQIEFRSDGTALLGGGSGYTYSLPDYSHIDLIYNGLTQYWSFWISGSTLTMTDLTDLNGPTCSFQKSA